MALDRQVLWIVQQNAPRDLAISPGTTNFLVVVNGGGRDVIVDNETYIRLIYTHTQCIGRAYHFVAVGHQSLLYLLTFTSFSASVIIFSRYLLLLQKSCDHLRTALRSCIDNP